MYCSVCTNPKQIEIVEDYIYRGSLRQTAERYGIGYRSLQRHIDFCIASIYSEVEERKYQSELKECEEYLRIIFGFRQRKTRPKSIIKKPVEFTWSRRGWEKPNGREISEQRRVRLPDDTV